MKNHTSAKILRYIKEKKQVAPKELIDVLDIKKRAVFKQLKKLYDEEKIDKKGTPPKVYYFIKRVKKSKKKEKTSSEIKKILDDNFLIISPKGERKEGIEAFSYWCKRRNLPFTKTAKEYKKTWQKYNKYKKDGLIDGTYKFKKTFKRQFVDKVFYIDFYSIERFGKTRLGWLLLYAKQTQDKKLIRELVLEFKDKVKDFVKDKQIDAVGFIPPTIKREVQIMKEVEKNLELKLSKISIKKIKTPVVVAQKTLKKLEDRIENASSSILVDETKAFGNILLIDDAVGSGATMNEVARKIRQRDICKGKIYGLSITGSFKGFAVISEI